MYRIVCFSKFVINRLSIVEQYYQEVKYFQKTVDSASTQSGTSHIISE